MKKYLPLSIVFFTLFSLEAQISVEYINLNAGDLIQQANNVSYYETQVAGENLNWDFSQLEIMFIDSLSVLYPSETSQVNDFPEANLAFGTNNLSIYSKLNTEGFFNLGFGGIVDSLNINASIAFTSVDTMLTFPINYGDTRRTSSWGISEPITVNVPDLGEQNIKVSHSIQRDFNCDAWGTMQTHMGTYDVLRVKEKLIMIDSVFAILPFGITMYVNDYSQFDTTYTYSFYTNDSNIKFKLAEISYNPENNIAESTKWITDGSSFLNSQPLHSSINIYPNPANNQIYINDPEKIKLITIHNQNGQEVLTSTKNKIDISELSAGIYFIEIRSQESTAVRKIIVN